MTLIKTAKTPTPIRRIWHYSKRFMQGAIVCLLVVIAILLAVSAYFNKRAGSPIFVATNTATPLTTTQSLTVYIDPVRHADSQLLLQKFKQHRPDIDLMIIDKISDSTPDVVLGAMDSARLGADKQFSSFDYAIAKPDQTLIGYMNDDVPAGAAFRDFLLSSTAQDIFINSGLDSIEPYRNLSNDYFNAPSTLATDNAKTATDTATQAVSGKK